MTHQSMSANFRGKIQGGMHNAKPEFYRQQRIYK